MEKSVPTVTTVYRLPECADPIIDVILNLLRKTFVYVHQITLQVFTIMLCFFERQLFADMCISCNETRYYITYNTFNIKQQLFML